MNRLFAEGVREEQVSAAFQSIPVVSILYYSEG